MERNLVYFVSDVHLGLDVNEPKKREARFVSFLKSIPADQTEALYMLGDIWDFWYEYEDVVPKGYVRVFAALTELMDAGVNVYFFPGNHDLWCYDYFSSLGIKILSQPYLAYISGKTFCLGHGDALGPGNLGYKLTKRIFTSRVTQKMFSALHPWFAFRLGNEWSRRSRLARREQYEFRGEDEPLYRFAKKFSSKQKVDYFIFGHYHCKVDETLDNGARLLVMRDWIDSSDYLYWDGISVRAGISRKME